MPEKLSSKIDHAGADELLTIVKEMKPAEVGFFGGRKYIWHGPKSQNMLTGEVALARVVKRVIALYNSKQIDDKTALAFRKEIERLDFDGNLQLQNAINKSFKPIAFFTKIRRIFSLFNREKAMITLYAIQVPEQAVIQPKVKFKTVSNKSQRTIVNEIFYKIADQLKQGRYLEDILYLVANDYRHKTNGEQLLRAVVEKLVKEIPLRDFWVGGTDPYKTTSTMLALVLMGEYPIEFSQDASKPGFLVHGVLPILYVRHYEHIRSLGEALPKDLDLAGLSADKCAIYSVLYSQLSKAHPNNAMTCKIYSDLSDRFQKLAEAKSKV